MKPAAFDYARPESVAAAIALLEAADGGAKVIAGGQSLGPILNLRLAQPRLLVDVTHIPELKEVTRTPDDSFIGSCVTHAQLEDGEVPDVSRGFMKEVAGGIAYRAVRNRGTIGGSACHADPAGDWVTALLLLSAVALIEGPDGRSEIGMTEFVTGPFSTQLDANQILVGFRIPGLGVRVRWSWYKFCRKPGEFADAIAAVLHDGESGASRAVIGATHGAPSVIDDASFLVERYQPEPARAALAAAGIAHDSYEMQVHEVALKRAALQLGST
jgi:carbon-monoxide dehydrogenase medium subunit